MLLPKFVVLDPLLRGVGQHHFEYDVHVLRAAERQGWQPGLAAHRDLAEQSEFAEGWEIHRAFQDLYDTSDLQKLYRCRRRLAAAARLTSALALAMRCRYRIRRWRHERRYARLTHGYRTAMNQVSADSRLTRGDQVFLATAMPCGYRGIGRMARVITLARKVDWHLQFHFPLIDAEIWYADRSRNTTISCWICRKCCKN